MAEDSRLKELAALVVAYLNETHRPSKEQLEILLRAKCQAVGR